MNQKINLKIDKKRVGIILLIVLMFLISIGVIVAGATLVGLNYKNFDMYNTLVRVWNENSGAASPNFKEYLNAYNALAASNSSWVVASYDLFATGVSLLCLGVILISLSIWRTLKLKQKNKNNS